VTAIELRVLDGGGVVLLPLPHAVRNKPITAVPPIRKYRAHLFIIGSPFRMPFRAIVTVGRPKKAPCPSSKLAHREKCTTTSLATTLEHRESSTGKHRPQCTAGNPRVNCESPGHGVAENAWLGGSENPEAHGLEVRSPQGDPRCWPVGSHRGVSSITDSPTISSYGAAIA